MTRRTSRRRSSRRLRPNKGFDTVYYWNGKWRAAAPLPPPLGRGETLSEMKAAIERMGYVTVLGSVSHGAPKTPPWRLQQNGEWRQEGPRRRTSLRRNAAGCAYCVSPPGRHKWWCTKLAKNSRRRTSRSRNP